MHRLRDLDRRQALVAVALVVALVVPFGASVLRARSIGWLPSGDDALIGLRAGQSIESPLPNARELRLRVTAIVYQPEASGDWHL